MKILITGANSFIGKNFIKYSSFKGIDEISLRDFHYKEIDYTKYEVIIHLAAIVHQKKKISTQEYNEVNRNLPIEIAKLAKKSGVKQFVFISSVSVYGNGNTINNTFNEESFCRPIDGYGISKLQAENELVKLKSSTFNISIIRPPMVYGEQAKANIYRLIRFVDRSPIILFPIINNLRSLVYVENLIKYIDKVITKKSQGIFIASDSPPLSTTDMVILISRYLKKKVYIINVPLFILRIVSKIKPSKFEKVFGSFILDNNRTREQLELDNGISNEEGFKKMIESYKKSAIKNK